MDDPFMATGFGELKVFSGSAHTELTREIASFLGVSVGQARLRRFPDTEVSFQIDENIRGTDVFIVQPTCASHYVGDDGRERVRSVDQHLVELLIMIDAFRRSSAARITAVLPYYGYARQDRKDKPRVPISAKLVANVLSAAGTNRVLTMDLHKAQIQGFFDIPVDHLFAAPVIIDYLARLDQPKLTLVSPDAGGAERARAYAKRLGAELAIIDKRRSPEDGAAEVMNVIGDVDGRTCILQDDIIDTAGTITKGANALKAAGAGRVLACAVHGVLSGPAVERIESSPIDQLIVTNTIPLSPAGEACGKIKVLSVARLLGQAIKSIHEETSVSSLFV
jgi:ribose-phosphate pyrophosphokinase